jgi:hypothetical protein
MPDYKKPTTVGSGNKKGTFIGDPSKVHIHIVGQNNHVKINGKATAFQLTDAGFKKAIGVLEENDDKKAVSGYANCLAWLKAGGPGV